MASLSGRVAFITGGASGIGFGIAAALANAGAKIVLTDQNEAALRVAAERLSARGATVTAERLEITDAAQWERALDVAERTCGPIEILCNNAGVSALGVSIEQISPAFWDRVIAINLTGIFTGLHAALPRMRAHGRGGHIVNTSSLAGIGLTGPGTAAYAVTKCGVVALSEVLKQELEADRIGVSVLCPGPVRTELWRSSREVLGLPPLEAPPAASRQGSASPTAMDPLLVGQQVVEAILNGEFYVITHPEFRSAVVHRHAQLMAAFDRAEAARPMLSPSRADAVT
jgi:NAD(P)-dependent dehydrogenase (short-subunit alcohol dehydrogenase family)